MSIKPRKYTSKYKKGDRVRIKRFGPLYNGTEATVTGTDGFYVYVKFDVNGTEGELYSTEVELI